MEVKPLILSEYIEFQI